MNNCCEIKIPVSLATGESARYSGGENVVVLNQHLHKIKEIQIDSSKLQNGKQTEFSKIKNHFFLSL